MYIQCPSLHTVLSCNYMVTEILHVLTLRLCQSYKTKTLVCFCLPSPPVLYIALMCCNLHDNEYMLLAHSNIPIVIIISQNFCHTKGDVLTSCTNHLYIPQHQPGHHRHFTALYSDCLSSKIYCYKEFIISIITVNQHLNLQLILEVCSWHQRSQMPLAQQLKELPKSLACGKLVGLLFLHTYHNVSPQWWSENLNEWCRTHISQ